MSEVVFCKGCNTPLVGQTMAANENRYHVDCFRCVTCEKLISPGDKFVLNIKTMELFCGKDYELKEKMQLPATPQQQQQQQQSSNSNNNNNKNKTKGSLNNNTTNNNNNNNYNTTVKADLQQDPNKVKLMRSPSLDKGKLKKKKHGLPNVSINSTSSTPVPVTSSSAPTSPTNTDGTLASAGSTPTRRQSEIDRRKRTKITDAQL
eukprot:Pgem_evm1s6411